MKKQILFFSFLMSCISSFSFAQTTVTFGGEVDTQIGVREQSKDYRFDNPHVKSGFSKNALNEGAVVNDTNLDISLDMETDSGIELGGEILLNTDTSLNKYRNTGYDQAGLETYVYIDTGIGRLEAGNTTGVYNDMKISGASVARATGGIDGDVKYWWHPHIYKDGTFVKTTGSKIYTSNSSPERLVEQNFIQSPNLPSNYDTGGEANAGKISYITPAMEGFRFGVSYIHDIAQHGSAKQTFVTLDRMTNYADPSLGFKEIYSGVAKYENKFDQTKIELSLAAEVGNSKYMKNPLKFDEYFARHGLRAWEVGAGIEDSGFRLAGSYGDWGRSGSLKRFINNTCRRSNYWTAGGSYEADDTGFSITYFGSNRCGVDSFLGYDFVTDAADSIYLLTAGTRALAKPKKMEILSFGVDTKLAPGFMPYGELSFFKIEENNGIASTAEVPFGSVTLRTDAAHNKRNVGYVLMSGVKIQF